MMSKVLKLIHNLKIQGIIPVLTEGRLVFESGDQTIPGELQQQIDALDVELQEFFKDLKFWQDTLPSVSERVQLPVFPSAVEITFVGEPERLCGWQLDAARWRKIKKQCKSLQVSPGTWLFTAWQLLLHKYSQQPSLSIALRDTSALVKNNAGEAGKNLPVQAIVAATETLPERLKSNQNAIAGATQHSNFSLAELNSVFADANNPSSKEPQTLINSAALSQFGFSFGGFSENGENPLAANFGFLQNSAQQFELLLELVERGGVVDCCLHLDDQLYHSAWCEKLSARFIHLVDQLLAKPKAVISELSIFSETEIQQVLLDFNQVSVEYPTQDCIHELFVAQAQRSPNSIAVSYEDKQLTFSELLDASSILATYLQMQGVSANTLVGFCLPRNEQLLVAILAILRAGGAYVPLDPDYPVGRLQHIHDDSQIKLLLTQESQLSLCQNISAENTQVLCLDKDWQEICSQAQGRKLKELAQPDHLAYIIYTSGSTGKPKGVAIEHRNATAMLFWAENQYSEQEIAGVMAATSVCFDLSIYEMFLPLSRGGEVIMMSNALELATSANRNKVTLINTVPSAAEELLAQQAIPDSVMTINLAGEPLSAALVDRLYDNCKVNKVYDLYGPSEDTTYSTFMLREKQAAECIGRPLTNTQAYVLGSNREPLPVGMPGELYLSGAGVARGYLHRAEATAEKFLKDPFNPEQRMYRTGDLAVWNSDGTLKYLGRIDTQVKIRGFRIEVGEIETRLTDISGVKDAVVVVQGEGTAKRLVAFVVAQGDSELVPEQLRENLSQFVPDYMVPSAWQFIDEVPLTPNGKIDRKCLTETLVALTSNLAYVAPGTQLEVDLVNIWSQVLRIAANKIGVNDSFFDLGGNSLSATQIFSRIARRYAVKLPIRLMFSHASVRQLASYLTVADSQNIESIKVLSRKPQQDFPLSYAQERLWALRQIEENDTSYHIPLALKYAGKLDIQALEQALNQVIARHDAMRTVFVTDKGRARQRILPEMTIRLAYSDITGEAGQQTLLQRLCHDEVSRAFDLTQGPLLRGRVIKLETEQYLILFTLHHIISDGWSLAVLVDELSQYMSGNKLADLAIQYVDFSQWQRRQMEENGTLERQLDYWKDKLKGVTQSLDMATDFPRGSVRDFRGGQVDLAFPVELHQQLQGLAEESGTTLYMVLMAIVKVLLFRHSGQTDICVGSPIANRQHAETEELIGMFVNTLALRDEVQPQADFNSILQQVKQTCLEAWEHQDAPFEKVVDALHPERNMALNPLFQVMMVLQNTPTERSDKAGSFSSKLTPFPLASEVSKFDLTFEFSKTSEGLKCRLEYCSGLYKASTITRMAAQLQKLCELIVAQPNKSVNQYQYLPDEELELVTEGFNNTDADFPRDTCVHELFLQQANANPVQIAVQDEHEQLNYAELAQRTEILARYLQQQGVGKDSLVGLYLSRSVDMMVSILGILRAGGAYVPLDPDYPEVRLQHMVSDSGCQLILSQSWHQERLVTLLPEQCKVLNLDTDWLGVQKQVQSSDQPLQQLSGATDLAYVIYTSGSTGKPKGVMLEHRALMNRVHWMQRAYPLGNDDVVLQKTPYSFDVSVWEFVWPIMVGARTVFARPGGHSDVAYLCNFINRSGVTVLHFVPSMLNIFLDHAPAKCPGVRYTFSSGEALNKRATEEYANVFPGGQLHNLYGPTEAAIDVTFYDCREVSGSTVPIGKPIDNTQIYLLDELLQPVPVGVPGELHIAGVGLARGYLNREDLTAEKFIANPFKVANSSYESRMYKSGDLARWLDDGNIEYLGRIDTQVKLRGFRIEVGEIEAQMLAHADVHDAAVVLQGSGNNQNLTGFYISDRVDSISNTQLKAHLSDALPAFMIPTFLQRLENMPLTPNGKADRKALMAMQVSHQSNATQKTQEQTQSMVSESVKSEPVQVASAQYADPHSLVASKANLQHKLAKIWCEVLDKPAGSINSQDNVFEVGGNSISIIELSTRLKAEFNAPITPSLLFKHSNIDTLSDYLSNLIQESSSNASDSAQSGKSDTSAASASPSSKNSLIKNHADYYEDSLAIVGISCHFSSAENRWQFWQKLLDGEECLKHLSKEEARMAGVPEALLGAPGFVPMSWWMEGKEYFDPEFFKISSGNAALMDPQYRQLLMHAWRAVEDAGYLPADIKDTSVFMTAGNNFYQTLQQQLQTQGHVLANSEEFVTWLMAQGGTIPTMVSYQLGLTGPAVFVHSNCSSSISGLYAASQSIFSGDAKFALVGAASLSPVKSLGYLHQPGMNLSGDGHIKTFDAGADGMVEGEGVGVVLVRKASEAIAAGDNIYGIIRGVGLNNDGNDKAGFYAPSVNGQASLIRHTLDKSGVSADSISYIEAHGTGTSLGDPIEVMALTEAFGSVTDKQQFCGLGSVKPNIGHLDSAAGIAGLIKLALSLYHKTHPALINYNQPNPEIDFDNSPFYVQDQNKAWQADAPLQRAAISSFGIGGTNGHAILEEYRAPRATEENSEAQLLVLSAQKDDVLREYCQSLLEFLNNPEAQLLDIADIAYTLQVGRLAMEHRVAFVAQDKTQLRDVISAYLTGEQSESTEPQWYAGHTLVNAIQNKQMAQDEDYQNLIQDWLHKRKVARLAELWVQGIELNWSILHQDRSVCRVSLPTYPFAKQAIWIDEVSNLATTSARVADIHPLVHKNISNLSQQRYVSRFTGQEFFLCEHIIAGQRTLPAVAYLEMVRAAVHDALPGLDSNDVLELHDIVWIAPVAVEQELDVSIVLEINAREGLDFTVSTEVEGELVSHCQGSVSIGERPALQIFQPGDMARETGSATLDVAALYNAYDKLGTQFGPAFKALTGLQQSEQQVLGHIALPEHIATNAHEFQLHPSIMDAALQAGTLLIAGPGNLPTEGTLPFAMQKISIFRPVRPESLVRVQFSEGSSAQDKMVKMDVDIMDSEGVVCIQIQGFSVRKMAQRNIGLYSAISTWQPISELQTSPSETASQRHLLLFDTSAEQFPEPADTVTHRLSLPENNSNAVRYQAAAEGLMQQLKNLLHSRKQQKVLMQVVLPITEGELDCAGLIGLMKSVSLENPRIKGQLLIIERDQVSNHLKSSLKQLAESGISAAWRLGSEGLQVQSWQSTSLPKELPTLPFKDNGCYLITGGTGALAQLFAHHILQQTSQAKILLTGRNAANARIRTQLEALGERASYIQLDLTDRDQVQKVLAQQPAEFSAICGVLHCAGMVADNFLIKKSEAELRAVFAPKVTGTENLDLACRTMQLDFMALFSSESSLGSMGQSDYAAANGFMNDFASWRNQLVQKGERHGHTVAICWPYWEQGGMHLDVGTLANITDETGMQAMSSDTGLNAFNVALNRPQGQILFIAGELDKIRRYVEQSDDKSSPKIAAKSTAAAAPKVDTQAQVSSLQSVPVAAANSTSGNDLKQQTVEYLQQQLATIFKLPASQIDANAALENYGIDSILAINLTNHLETVFGALSKTLFFEYQNVSDLADYFVENHLDTLSDILGTKNSKTADVDGPKAVSVNAEANKADEEVKPKSISSRFSAAAGLNAASRAAPQAMPGIKTAIQDDIAIVGLSGRYPESGDVQQYWDNLAQGKDCITEIPLERWDWRDYFSQDKTTSGAHFSKVGGFIQGVDEFDPKFFNISPREAMILDPQERMFLQHAWMALEDAGFTRDDLQIQRENMLPGQVGVYVGVMYGEYQLFGAESSMQGKRMGFASSLADIANRVSYVMNLHGPSLTIDTMCSSSLTSVHMAWQDLKSGRTDMAIAGGVNLNLHPNKYLILSSGQYISVKGHCHSFGIDGDGYIPGEGVGAVLLKRLTDAERDGDHIYGVIRGSAINHGGKVNGYTVPNPAAQADVIQQALQQANLNPRHVSYIEAHGTGTSLGDPIEIAALTKAFKKGSKPSGHDKDTGYCLVGSAKSNIGHCEPAAGIAGITKVLMQLRHKKVAPSLHSSTLNPHIDFDSTPFEVNQTLKDWQQPEIDGEKVPRIAGISSFGAGGANAHILISEYQPKEKQESYQAAQYLVPLSARTAEQLRQRASALLNFMQQQQEAPDIASVAYTLQNGREAMEERLAFLVVSNEELLSRLSAFVNGEKAIADCYQGQVKKYREGINGFNQDEEIQEAIDKWFQRKKYGKLLNVWTKGLSVDWNQLYGEGPRPGKVSLPAYPFAKERYWWDGTHIKTHGHAGKTFSQTGNVASSQLHPLLQENTSNLMQQSYHSQLHSDLSFLTQGLLPVSAMLEMAACAMSLAANEDETKTALQITHFSAGQACRITESVRVGLALFPDTDRQVRFELYGAVDDVVYCQGQASYINDTLQQMNLADWFRYLAVDPQQMQAVQHTTKQAYFSYQRNNLMLLQLPAGQVNAQSEDYQIVPGLVEFAIQQWLSRSGNAAVLAYISQIAKVLWLRSLDGECYLLVKPAAGLNTTTVMGSEAVDIEVRDTNGHLCLLLQGANVVNLATTGNSAPTSVGNVQAAVVPEVSKTSGVQARTNTPDHNVTSSKSVALSREIPLNIKITNASDNTAQDAIEQQDSEPYPVNKPNDVVLSEFAAVDRKSQSAQTLSKPLVRLAEVNGSNAGSRIAFRQKLLRLVAEDSGIYKLHIENGQSDLSEELCSALSQALQQVAAHDDVKVLQIHASEQHFLSGATESFNLALQYELFTSLKQMPFPVVAVCQGGATGAGFILAALCDFMVLNEAAIYGLRLTGLNTELTNLLQTRFDARLTQQLIFGSEGITGSEWRQKGLKARIVGPADVRETANALSTDLAERPAKALRLLKQHLARQQIAVLNVLPALKQSEPIAVKAFDLPKSPARYLRLSQPKNGILQVDFVKQKARYGLKALVISLQKLLQNLPSECNSVLLHSEHENFIPDSSDSVSTEYLPVWQSSINSSPVPVIAVLSNNTSGAGWLCALCCDVQLYSTDAEYSVTGSWQEQFSLNSADALLKSRLGESLAREALLSGDSYTGAALTARGFVQSAESSQLLPGAVVFAAGIVKQPTTFWKQYRGELLPLSLQKNTTSLSETAVSLEPQEKQAVVLQSEVIKAWRYDNGVLLVTMEDREAKNMHSQQTLDGLQEVFAHIEAAENYKAVVLTGYDNYFSSGGTKDDLVAIQKGQAQFTDVKIYHLALACKLPVIAAMQGHAIGAGWALGMFADFNFFSQSARYISPYMNLGFTPGAGATFILPRKLGQDLAFESLMFSNELDGRMLQDRNVAMPILAKQQVLESALALANKLSRYSINILLALKRHWSEQSLAQLDEIYDRELAMHEETFVGQEETLLQIERSFNAIGDDNSGARTFHAEQQALPAVQAQEPQSVAAVPSSDSILLALKTSLSAELQMDMEELDEHEQFVDLGLDSIYGVTWVRKINEQFGLNLEAVIVYSYPNLHSFSEYLNEVLNQRTNPQVADQPLVSAHEATGATEVKQSTPQTDARPASEVEGRTASYQTSAPLQTNVSASAATASATTEAPEQILQSLREMLAEELHMPVAEVDDNAQFVDLGLDSIYGVTWVRKINDKYELNMEAVIIYSYPTLKEFTDHIYQQLSQQQPAIQSVPQVENVAVQAPINTPASATNTLAPTASETTVSDLHQVTAILRGMLAQELHMPESEVDPQAQFVDLGLDSIYGVTWVRKINEHFGLNIEAVQVYSYPTLEEFSQHVAELKLPATAQVTQTATAVAVAGPVKQTQDTQSAPNGSTLAETNVTNLNTSQSSLVNAPPALEKMPSLISWRKQGTGRAGLLSEPTESAAVKPQAIAIVGMAGQFPQADNVSEFWQNIAKGRNCISEVPEERWPLSRYYQAGEPVAGKTNSKWMGAVSGHDLFDPLFFNIAPTEAENMDPQQRLFLQNCWHAVEDAAYSAEALSGSKCGVFVGCSTSDYHLLAAEHQTSAQAFTGGSTSILAARISYFMNLQGPSIAVDTACSSSLVAIANACDSLCSGSSDMALAGGVCIMSGPEMHLMTAQAGMLSVDGRCFTFDQRANGFVPAEGVGVVMLKRLEDAQHDGDNIHAVIEGWGVNQDGKTNGITAPNPAAQTRLETDVYQRFDIDPAQIQLVEAHGTGTKLGDPIEVRALKDSFAKFTDKQHYCALGSVKSNMGHAVTAAGVASVIKVASALQHQQLPPTINFDNLNEHIGLQGSPFYINDKLQPWQVNQGEKRRAIVSSFGFSGTNAHLVLTEVPDKAPVFSTPKNAGPVAQVIPLSAKTNEQLRQIASSLVEHLQSNANVSMADLAFTLQTGRTAMAKRLALVCQSVEQLRQMLQSWQAQPDAVLTDVYYGGNNVNAKSKQTLAVGQHSAAELAQTWAAGSRVDWQSAWQVKAQKLRLPLYPFAKERYWLHGSTSAQSNDNNGLVTQDALPWLHPLLQANESNFYQQRFSSQFTGNEHYLKDHKVAVAQGEFVPVLPGMAYLEMARVALQLSLPDLTQNIRLKNVVWLRPLVVSQAQKVTISLNAVNQQIDTTDSFEFSIYSANSAGEEQVPYCQGQLQISEAEAIATDLIQQSSGLQKLEIDSQALYSRLQTLGLDYGYSHQFITQLKVAEGRVLANLTMPDDLKLQLQDYVLHPGMLDCALQAAVVMPQRGQTDEHEASVPFALDQLDVLAPCTADMQALVKIAADSSQALPKLDISLYDNDGNLCVRMSGFSTRAIASDPADAGINPEVYQVIDSSDDGHYQQILDKILNNQISAEEAAKLG
ncbi:MAG: amino acid adenylation domain-containing protein [Aestuariibacter sp.]